MKFTGGLPETGCGHGSTLGYTEHLRAELPKLLRRLGITRFLDAPCGDFNWMASTDLRSLEYVGGDIDPTHLATAHFKARTAASQPPDWCVFISIDLTRETPRTTDLMLCRDFLQHLPTAVALDVLRGFVRSETPWLLTTSHEAEANIDLLLPGGFRPLDLTKSPFSLPPPVEAIADWPGSGRILGLWYRDVVAEVLK